VKRGGQNPFEMTGDGRAARMGGELNDASNDFGQHMRDVGDAETRQDRPDRAEPDSASPTDQSSFSSRNSDRSIASAMAL
jgi:hypothetical protein